jgi:hypothetical protein
MAQTKDQCMQMNAFMIYFPERNKYVHDKKYIYNVLLCTVMATARQIYGSIHLQS